MHQIPKKTNIIRGQKFDYNFFNFHQIHFNKSINEHKLEFTE